MADYHKRNKFDQTLRLITTNNDEFAKVFKSIIDSTKPAQNSPIMSRFGHMQNDDIKKFYEGATVGEYEKASDLLSDIMTDENETELAAVIGALDMKMIEAMDREQEKELSKKNLNKIPDLVDVPDFGDSNLNVNHDYSAGY